MVWAALAAAAASYVSSESQKDNEKQQAGNQSSETLASQGAGAPVTVSVGGLNVPAYPNFPRMETNLGQTVMQPATMQTVASDGRFYLLAGAVVLAVFLSKVLK